MARIAVGNRAYHQLDGAQCLVNAVTGEVKSARPSISGKATFQELWQFSDGLLPNNRDSAQFARQARKIARFTHSYSTETCYSRLPRQDRKCGIHLGTFAQNSSYSRP